MRGGRVDDKTALRINRRKLLIGAGAAMVAGGTVVGRPFPWASAARPSSSPPTDGGTFRLGLVGSTNDLIDGQYIVTKADQARLVSGWETLVSYDENFDISYDNALAEEVEAKAADLYVIRLKQGIEFSDGRPVTADDVIYSFQRRLDPDLGLAPALAQFLDADGLKKVDDRTVEVQLLTGNVTFVNGLAEYIATVVPVGYERYSGDVSTQIGTGPYLLTSFTPGSESVHEKNPYYWDTGKPYFDEVHIIDFADGDAMINALLADQIDICADIPSASVDTVTGTTATRSC